MDKKITKECFDTLLKEIEEFDTDEFDISDVLSQYFGDIFILEIPDSAPFPIALTPCKECVRRLSETLMNPEKSVDDFVDMWMDEDNIFVLTIGRNVFKRMSPVEVTRLILYTIGQVRFGMEYPKAIYSGIYETLSDIGNIAFRLFNYRKFKKYLGLAITIPCIGIPDTMPNENVYDPEVIDISELGTWDFMKPEFVKAEPFKTASRMSMQLFFIIEQISKKASWTNDSIEDVIVAANEQSVTKDIADSIEEFKTEASEMCKERLCSSIDKYVTEGYYTEFFGLGKKSVPRVDPNEIDYISVMIDSIKSPNDKLMVLGYINSKIDILEFYESILSDPRKAKKYVVPYTLESIQPVKKLLLTERKRALGHSIPKQMIGLNVSYPTGYEG